MMVLEATTPVNTTIANASMEVTNGFASSFGLRYATIAVLYVVGALLAAQFVAPWLARSEMLSRVTGGFVWTAVYAIKGAAASAVLLVAAAPAYFVATMDSGTRGFALEAIGIAVAGYIALVVVGVLADRAASAFLDAHPTYDEWGDVFGASEGDEDGTEAPP